MTTSFHITRIHPDGTETWVCTKTGKDAASAIRQAVRDYGFNDKPGTTYQAEARA